ncbi:unnamed protein product [Moneuplotes crassus]|uniref:Uncharacterized protein n=1 Tax=Euplotes crassus TaxID=5936 RepID=A0AAD1XRD9_EUPCR|nr:unnamed protein product [Moneuplotes crassus]
MVSDIKEREDTIGNRKDLEVRPSQFSERRPNRPRRSLSSSNVLRPRQRECCPCKDARPSSSDNLRRPILTTNLADIPCLK